MPDGANPQRVDRSAFLYEDPQPPVNQFAQCGTCVFFQDPGCPLIGERGVTAEMSCGLYCHGKPGSVKGVKQAATAEEAGLVDRPVRCENCRFFRRPGTCGLFDMLNRTRPDTFKLDIKVNPKGCCDANTARPRGKVKGYAKGGTVRGFADGGATDQPPPDLVMPGNTADVGSIAGQALHDAGPSPEDTFYAALLQHGERSTPSDVSPKGAMGQGQVMPQTLRDPGFGVRPAADTSKPELDRVSRDYASALYNRYGGDWTLASAAYDAGPTTVDRWLKQYGDPRQGKITDAQFAQLIPYDETKGYVGRVAPQQQAPQTAVQPPPDTVFPGAGSQPPPDLIFQGGPSDVGSVAGQALGEAATKPLTFGQKIGQGLREMARSATTDTAANFLKSAAVAAEAGSEFEQTEQAPGEPMITTEPTESPLFKAGEKVEQYGKEQIPVDQRFEQSLPGKIAAGAGQLPSYLAAGLVGGPLGVGVVGAAQFAGPAAEAAKKAGATPEQQEAVGAGNAVIGGAGSIIPVESLLLPIGRASGLLKDTVVAATKNALRSGSIAATANAAMTFASNLLTKFTYDPKQDPFEGVPSSAAVGAVVGAGAGAVAGAKAPVPAPHIGERTDLSGGEGPIVENGPPPGPPPAGLPGPRNAAETETPPAAPESPAAAAKAVETQARSAAPPPPPEGALVNVREGEESRPAMIEGYFGDGKYLTLRYADGSSRDFPTDIIMPDLEVISAETRARELASNEAALSRSEESGLRGIRREGDQSLSGVDVEQGGLQGFHGRDRTETGEVLQRGQEGRNEGLRTGQRTLGYAETAGPQQAGVRAVDQIHGQGTNDRGVGAGIKNASADALHETEQRLASGTSTQGKDGSAIEGGSLYQPFGQAPNRVGVGQDPGAAAQNAQTQATQRNAPGTDSGATSASPTDTLGSRQHPINAQSTADIAAASAQANPEPTQAEIKSGVYKKGHLTVQGLPVTVETPAGAMRRGTGANGQPWEVQLRYPYGYVKGSKGADGEPMDVYIGPHPDSPDVFVFDQIDPQTGQFDEHKAVLGARNEAEAASIYDSGFSDGSGPQRRGAVTPMPVDAFKDWLKSKRTGPLSYTEPPTRQPHEATEANVIADLDNGTVKPKPMDVAARYGIEAPAAAKLLEQIYQRPDSPIELASGRNETDPMNLTWRKISPDKREARVADHATWAWQKFGLNRMDYPSDTAFIEALRDRASLAEKERDDLENRAADLDIHPSAGATTDEIRAMIAEREAIMAEGAEADRRADAIEAEIDDVARRASPEVMDEIPWSDERTAERQAEAGQVPETVAEPGEAGHAVGPSAGEAAPVAGARPPTEGSRANAPEGAAGPRPVDSNGKPIFKVGERVVLQDEGDLRGRHGTVTEANGLTMQPLFSGKSETSYSYRVKTDQGTETVASRLEPEAGRPPGKVIPDPQHKGEFLTEAQLSRHVAWERGRAKRLREAADRARKPERKRELIDEAKRADEESTSATKALDKWRRENGVEAKAEPIPAIAAPVPEVPQPRATVRENEDRNGIEIKFNARPDDATLGKMKAAGFRWSKFQKIWYARRSDATRRVANEVSGAAEPTSAPTRSPEGEAQRRANAEGARAEIDNTEHQPAAMPITAAAPELPKDPDSEDIAVGDTVNLRPEDQAQDLRGDTGRTVVDISPDGSNVTLDGGATVRADQIEPNLPKPAGGGRITGKETGDGVQGALRPGAQGQEPGPPAGVGAERPVGQPLAGEVDRGARPAGPAAGIGIKGAGRPAEGPASAAVGRGARSRADVGLPAEPERETARGPADAQVRGTNHTIEPGSLAEDRGPKSKALDNIAAIELAKRLIAEDRPAIKDEQTALAKYVGWGGLAGAFQDSTGKFGSGFEDVGRRLKELLTPEEYKTAARSTQYAHYTAEHVIRSMWHTVGRMGFNGTTVFEPGMGVGHFLGMMPPDLAKRVEYQGLELDHLTASIAKLLYPESGVRQADMTETPLPDNEFDLAIGNPPFSDTVIKADPKYKALGLMLHDYFFAKSLDAVRPGGLMGFITSAGTMNKIDDSARRYLAARSEFVGGVRLPSTAFKRNAGTEVTTDILFFKKRPAVLSDAEVKADPANSWVGTVQRDLPTADGGKAKANVSRYFSEHPEQVLGTEGLFDKLYKGRYAVHAPENYDIEMALREALDRLPGNVMERWPNAQQRAEADLEAPETKDGSFYVKDGRLFQYSGGVGRPMGRRGAGTAGGLSTAEHERVTQLVPIRDALRQVYVADLAQDAEGGEAARRQLNGAYDAFVKKFGPVNKATFQARRPNIVQQESARAEAREIARDRGEPWREGDFDPSVLPEKATLAEIARARDAARQKVKAEGRIFNEGSFDPDEMPDLIIEKRPNVDAFMDDPESYRLRAIEDYNDSTGEARKKRVFYESVLTRELEPVLNSANDGVLWSLNKFGGLDLDEIAAKMKRTREDLVAELGDSAFRLPGTDNTYVMADEYLSGDVVDKLAEARAAAVRDPALARNVQALEAAQPAPLAPSEITMNLGMPWIPPDMVKSFVADQLRLGVADIVHSPALGGWVVNGRREGLGMAQWGIEDRNAFRLLGDALNRTPPRIYKDVYSAGSKSRVFDAAATQAAADKIDGMRQAFQDFLGLDPARRDQLADIYNSQFNRIVPRRYDGSYLTTPGISKDFTWRPHQRRAVARIIQSGNTYLGHAVGAGKTAEMIGSAMEMRRLGLVKKPLVIVPNHMLGQFTKEWYEQYPTAKLAIADERRFHTSTRKQFIANVAQDDLDGVILTHSAFGKLPISRKFQRSLIHEEIAKLEEAMQGLDPRNDRVTRKRLENMKEKLEERMRGAFQSRKDEANTFEEMGVDFLYVDEAHQFRKLAFASKQSLKGITPEGSDMAWDLYSKIRYLEGKTPGRSVVLASGTPITNTMGELYTLSRYMQRQELEKRGLGHFDSWAGAFGDTKTALEQTADGGYQSVTRFARFVNVPELYRMVSSIMDVVTPQQLEQYVVRPKLKGGKRQFHLAPKSPELEAYQADLARRVELIKQRKRPPQPGDDILLSVINDGRHAAIDMRFVDSDLPTDPESKLNQMIENAFNIWQRGKDTKFFDPASNYSRQIAHGPSTQMIFANLGTGGSESRAFSGYAWIKRELVRRGIPPKEIAFIGDHKTHVARQKLFNDMNEGKVRILIGSTQKMGTGVNAQRRLAAIHNQDPLWYPADDEQRVGRGLRQGNLNPEIEIHDYSTKGTYDAQMWHLMGNKGRFIEQFFRGDPSLRDMEDLGEASQYEQASAIATADERLIQLTDLRQQLDRMRLRATAHDREQYAMRHQLAERQKHIQWIDQTVPLLEQDIAQRVDTRGDKFKMTVGGNAFTERKPAAEAIGAAYKTTWGAIAKTPNGERRIGELGGFPFYIANHFGEPVFGLKVAGGDLLRLGDDKTSAMGMIRSAEDKLTKFEDRIRYLNDDREKAITTVESLRSQIGKAFAGMPEINRLQDEVTKLEAAIKATQDAKDKAKQSAAPAGLPADNRIAELQDAIRANAEAYHRRQIDHETFKREANRLHRELEEAGGSWPPDEAQRASLARPHAEGAMVALSTHEMVGLGKYIVGRRPLAPAYVKAQRNIAARVNAVLAQIAPGARSREMTQLFERGAAGPEGEIYGAYYGERVRDGLAHIIAWSLAAPDHLAVARHEAIHYLRRAGLFTEDEWSRLSRAARDSGWISAHQIDKRYPDLTTDQKIEEAIAEEFAAWRGRRGLIDRLPQWLQSIFSKMMLALRRIGDVARQVLGREAMPDDIFSRVESGEVGGRASPSQIQAEGLAASRPEEPLLPTRETTQDELAARQRQRDKGVAEVGMRGKIKPKKPQEIGESAPLFGGKGEQGTLFARPGSKLSAPQRKQFEAALELARAKNLRIPDDGRPVVLRNDFGISRDRFVGLDRNQMVNRLRDAGVDGTVAGNMVDMVKRGDEPTINHVMDVLNLRLTKSKKGEILHLDQDVVRALRNERQRDLGLAGAGEPPEPPLGAGGPPPEGPGGPIRRAAFWAWRSIPGLQEVAREIQMKTSPMAVHTATEESRHIAKEYANEMRLVRAEWAAADDHLVKNFTPEQRRRMWETADEESVLRQRGIEPGDAGLAKLSPDERAAVELNQVAANDALNMAREAGMFEGEGLPSYAPRMVVMMTHTGMERVPRKGPERAQPVTGGIHTTSQHLIGRRYLEAAETEEAAKKKFGAGAMVVRDIRTLPLATSSLKRAIAGRVLINRIRKIGADTGQDLVVDGEEPVGTGHKWFTIPENPAFWTWRPKFTRKDAEGKIVANVDENGKIKPLLDENGDIVFERVPIFVRGDFEGPLKAVMTEREGPIYRAFMALKAKTMSVIMYSPLIHNGVEWGRALPAMPGKVLTLKAYFEGNAAKRGLPYYGVGSHIKHASWLGRKLGYEQYPEVGLSPQMREFIQAGMVPIGHRYYVQDITSMMEEPDLAPGRSWTAKLLAFVPGLFDERWSDATKRAIDRAGDFWHNTLLWDRVGDLQMGLALGIRDEFMARGMDRNSATVLAAHFANRFAGALPLEAMSAGMRKFLNFLLFSRTFTMGNLGAMKDAMKGLPLDVQAELIAHTNRAAQTYAKTLAQRKAAMVIATDIALYHLVNAFLQSAIAVLAATLGGSQDQDMVDKFGDAVMFQAKGYLRRFQQLMTDVADNPLHLLDPLYDLRMPAKLLPQSENEPGAEDRVLVGYASDGTAIYMRNPTGKIGAEFEGWLADPLGMVERKMGTVARPIFQAITNDKGFGRHVWDPNATTLWDHMKNIGRTVDLFFGDNIPTQAVKAAWDMLHGVGSQKLELGQTLGPLGGFTFSRGAPGGPAVGEYYQARQRHEFDVQQAMPGIRDQILRGDYADAMTEMNKLGMSMGYQHFVIQTTVNPASRLSKSQIRDFMHYASPDEQATMNRLIGPPQ